MTYKIRFILYSFSHERNNMFLLRREIIDKGYYEIITPFLEKDELYKFLKLLKEILLVERNYNKGDKLK